MTDALGVFTSAAGAFADLVRRIPTWDGPGLGDWDMRALVGHTSRSLITVSAYVRAPADREDVVDPADYYVRIRELAAAMGTGDIVERGRQAGRDLGGDPVAAVDDLLATALRDAHEAGDPLIAVIGGLGLRLSTYLPTRTFELAVHGLDIARAAGIDFDVPDDVLAEAVGLATEVALRTGSGGALLLALTGREPLPAEFSVV